MINWPLRALALLAVSSVVWVWAATPPTATVTWIPPTAYNDGTVLPVGDVDHYTVSWTMLGSASAGGALTVTGLTAQVPIPCGTAQFRVTATTGASAIYPNATSDAAGPVPFASGVSCVPNPPGALAVH